MHSESESTEPVTGSGRATGPEAGPGPEPVAGSGPGAGPGPPAGPLEARAERALTASLRLTYIPVVVLILAGLGAFAYGIAVFIHSLGSIVGHPFPVGNQIGYFLLDIDLFLIGVTLLISAIGLYELFIRDIPGDQAIVPAWLEIHDLNALKARVLAMIVLVLAVSFAEVAVDSPNGRQVLELGGGVALVIVALTIFMRLTGHADD
jgi:uncharacterized membrane protein YqhA